MNKTKKIISLLLSLIMILSIFNIVSITTGAVTYENTKLYFDVNGTGWTMGAKDKVGFYIYGDDFEPIAWGGKKTLGTNEGDGIFSFDPAAKKIELEEGVQYKVIFTKNTGEEHSADLYFDTSCFGHCAYCNGEMIENPVDSSKKSQVALWKDLDPAKYGPVKGITSLGNVVGTCLPQGKTDEDLFNTWLIETGPQSLKNAMKYTVQPGKKTSQQLVDDIGAALGLTKDFVMSAIEENAAGIAEALALVTTLTVAFDWSYDNSTLPGGSHIHKSGEPVQENLVPATCTAQGSYDEVTYCTVCKAELSRESKTIDKLAHTPVTDKAVPATCTETGLTEGSHCSVCKTVLVEQTVIPALGHKPIIDKAVEATCQHDGHTIGSYCENCGEVYVQSQVIPKLPHTPVKDEAVPATCTHTGLTEGSHCSVCGDIIVAQKVIAKLQHTAGKTVIENDVPVTCATDGSHDEVVYCTVCKNEISRKTITAKALGHSYEIVPGKPATYLHTGLTDGVKCSRCGEWLIEQEVIPKLTGEGILGDIDGDGEVSVLDATYIQRYATRVKVPFTDDQMLIGDVDGDGELTVLDATYIQRFATRVKVPYPVGEALK